MPNYIIDLRQVQVGLLVLEVQVIPEKFKHKYITTVYLNLLRSVFFKGLYLP
jgi:hypothetical protein